ncbi:unnamed protein product, partial [marine sediment metagenome]
MSSENKREWEETTLRETRRRAPERRERFETSSGAEVQPLYTPEDLSAWDYRDKLGFPGEYPFTRG